MAGVEFSGRYSEREWGVIEPGIRRVISSVDIACLRDRLLFDMYLSAGGDWPVDMARLRNKLEWLGLNCVSMPSIDLDQQLKFLVGEEERMAEWRGHVLEEGRLAPEQQRLVDALREVEQLHQDRAIRLGQDYNLPLASLEVHPDYYCIRYKVPLPKNAQNAVLDCYVESLLLEFICIGGVWLPGKSNTKAIRNFIADCARPVVGAKSTTDRAIGERLRRLDERRRREGMTGKSDNEFVHIVERVWRQRIWQPTNANEL